MSKRLTDEGGPGPDVDCDPGLFKRLQGRNPHRDHGLLHWKPLDFDTVRLSDLQIRSDTQGKVGSEQAQLLDASLPTLLGGDEFVQESSGMVEQLLAPHFPIQHSSNDLMEEDGYPKPASVRSSETSR